VTDEYDSYGYDELEVTMNASSKFQYNQKVRIKNTDDVGSVTSIDNEECNCRVQFGKTSGWYDFEDLEVVVWNWKYSKYEAKL
jgi:hypothetical protein